jgi:hypothetical protein
MNSKIISPRYIYFGSIATRLAGAVFLTFLVFKSIGAGQIVLAVFLGACAVTMFWWAVFVMKYFIFAAINFSTETMTYGNLFVHNEIRLLDVSLEGTYLYMSRILKVRIANKRYFIHCYEDDVKRHFKTTH